MTKLAKVFAYFADIRPGPFTVSYLSVYLSRLQPAVLLLPRSFAEGNGLKMFPFILNLLVK